MNVPASSKGAPPLPPLEVAAIQAPPPPPPLPQQQQQQQLTSAQALQVESQLPAQIMEVPSLDYVVEDISNLSLVTHPDAQQQQQQQQEQQVQQPQQPQQQQQQIRRSGRERRRPKLLNDYFSM